MKKVLMGLTALPFLAGVAAAGQQLTDQQLDRVTAGFTATSIADAEGIVGESGSGIWRGEINRRHITIGKTCGKQRLHHQIMRAGTLCETDALAFEIADRMNNGIPGYQYA